MGQVLNPLQLHCSLGSTPRYAETCTRSSRPRAKLAIFITIQYQTKSHQYIFYMQATYFKGRQSYLYILQYHLSKSLRQDLSLHSEGDRPVPRYPARTGPLAESIENSRAHRHLTRVAVIVVFLVHDLDRLDDPWDVQPDVVAVSHEEHLRSANLHAVKVLVQLVGAGVVADRLVAKGVEGTVAIALPLALLVGLQGQVDAGSGGGNQQDKEQANPHLFLLYSRYNHQRLYQSIDSYLEGKLKLFGSIKCQTRLVSIKSDNNIKHTHGPISQNTLQRQRRQDQGERSHHQMLFLPFLQQQTHSLEHHHRRLSRKQGLLPHLGHWHLRVLVRPRLQKIRLPLLRGDRQRKFDEARLHLHRQRAGLQNHQGTSRNGEDLKREVPPLPLIIPATVIQIVFNSFLQVENQESLLVKSLKCGVSGFILGNHVQFKIRGGCRLRREKQKGISLSIPICMSQ